MKIATFFKRAHAPVSLPGRTYHFVPINPADPDSVHVADVEDEAHIARLLSIPEGYYEYKPTTLTRAAPAPAPAAEPVAPAVAESVAVVVKSAPPADPVASVESPPMEEAPLEEVKAADPPTPPPADRVTELLSLSVAKLRAQLKNVDAQLARELVKAEADREDPRTAYIELLDGHLAALKKKKA